MSKEKKMFLFGVLTTVIIVLLGLFLMNYLHINSNKKDIQEKNIEKTEINKNNQNKDIENVKTNDIVDSSDSATTNQNSSTNNTSKKIDGSTSSYTIDSNNSSGKSTSSTQSSNGSNRNSSTNSNSGTNTTNSSSGTNTTNSNPEADIPKQDPNAIDTNHILYSNHHGQIDYKRLFDCNSGGFSKMENDDSISSFSCVEVYSVSGNVLGYYLEIRY